VNIFLNNDKIALKILKPREKSKKENLGKVVIQLNNLAVFS
jgi:hypothetical protein